MVSVESEKGSEDGELRERERSHERQQLGEGAKTVGGLEKGQRRMEADERRIKDQDDNRSSGDASSV